MVSVTSAISELTPLVPLQLLALSALLVMSVPSQPQLRLLVVLATSLTAVPSRVLPAPTQTDLPSTKPVRVPLFAPFALLVALVQIPLLRLSLAPLVPSPSKVSPVALLANSKLLLVASSLTTLLDLATQLALSALLEAAALIPLSLLLLARLDTTRLKVNWLAASAPLVSPVAVLLLFLFLAQKVTTPTMVKLLARFVQPMLTVPLKRQIPLSVNSVTFLVKVLVTVSNVLTVLPAPPTELVSTQFLLLAKTVPTRHLSKPTALFAPLVTFVPSQINVPSLAPSATILDVVGQTAPSAPLVLAAQTPPLSILANPVSTLLLVMVNALLALPDTNAPTSMVFHKFVLGEHSPLEAKLLALRALLVGPALPPLSS
jgi:hypothetical protein